MLLQRIQQLFIDSADFKYQCAQSLGNKTDLAVQAVFSSLTNGGKIMVAGMGATQPLAHYMTALLLGRFERDRPELAALLLGVHGSSGSLDQHSLTREVRALGASEDLLLVIRVIIFHNNKVLLLIVVHSSHQNVFIFFSNRY